MPSGTNQSENKTANAVKKRPTLPSEVSERITKYFTIEKLLGEGNYGTVYRTRSIRSTALRPRYLALKIINLNDSPGMRAVYTEAYISERVRHKHIIQTFGHLWLQDHLYLLSQHASKGELFSLISPGVGIGNKVYKYLYGIVEAVKYLHGLGIAHRDLKPENVLLTNDDQAKLCDFGLAALCHDPDHGFERALKDACGTEAYIAVEIFERKKYSGYKSDMWSLGILWLVILKGEMPWDRPDKVKDQSFSCWLTKRPVEPWRFLDKYVITILRRLIHPRPERRMLCPELLRKLQPLLEQETRTREVMEQLNDRQCIIGTQSRSQRYQPSKRPLESDDTYEPSQKRRVISSSQPAGFDYCSTTMLSQEIDDLIPMENEASGTDLNEVKEPANKRCAHSMRYQLTRFRTKGLTYHELCAKIQVVVVRHCLTCTKNISDQEILITSSQVDFSIRIHPIGRQKSLDCIVEFQRKSGDGFRFQKIYRFLKSAILTEADRFVNGDDNDQGFTWSDDLPRFSPQDKQIKVDLEDVLDPILPIPGTPESYERGYADTDVPRSVQQVVDANEQSLRYIESDAALRSPSTRSVEDENDEPLESGEGGAEGANSVHHVRACAQTLKMFHDVRAKVKKHSAKTQLRDKKWVDRARVYTVTLIQQFSKKTPYKRLIDCETDEKFVNYWEKIPDNTDDEISFQTVIARERLEHSARPQSETELTSSQ